jgi:hypothetical protein
METAGPNLCPGRGDHLPSLRDDDGVNLSVKATQAHLKLLSLATERSYHL